jgi:LAO/AO transport system kinase
VPGTSDGGPRADADLAARVLAGDLRALARALTVVENDAEAGAAVLQGLRGRTGRAHRVGVTGPPGAGKSTLISALTALWRKAGRRVGVLAVDPTSPFTGGALLGDRVRMTQHLGDAGVFVRSLASRGHEGGLAAAAEDAADVLDAAGFDPVVLETVGVGQGEVEVARAADTTVLVLGPGSGDDVQAMKAGLAEVADVVVVNQGDHPGAERLAAQLASAYELRQGVPAPPVLRTVATTGEGVGALLALLDDRAGAARATETALRRAARARRRIVEAVERRLAARFWPEKDAALEREVAAVLAGRASAADAAARLTDGGAR